MANYISDMPLWAIILFIASFLYSIAFIANPAKEAAINAGLPAKRARNIQLGVWTFYIAYLAYTAILSLQGRFHINSVPLQVIFLTAAPLTLFLFIVVGNTGLFKRLLRSATLHSLIRLHIFRLVGVFFILLYFYHLLPTDFALSAGFGDIITAISSIFVAKWVAERKSWGTKAVYVWNIFGMLDIISLLVLAFINSQPTVAHTGPTIQEMTMFPFVWFPAFAPATILFLHIAVFQKLRLGNVSVNN
jgi:hypothetical protein